MLLTRLQFDRAFNLGSAFHHWWTACGSCPHSAPRHVSPEAWAMMLAIDGEYAANAISVDTIHALAKLMAPASAEVVYMAIANGCVVHTTGTGRTSWTVDATGTAIIEVFRPAERADQDARRAAEHHLSILESGLTDLEPAIVSLEAELFANDAFHAHLKAKNAGEPCEVVGQLAEAARAAEFAQSVAFGKLVTARNDKALDAFGELGREESLCRTIEQLFAYFAPLDADTGSALDAYLNACSRPVIDTFVPDMVRREHAMFLAMRALKDRLIEVARAELAKLPPASIPVVRATVGPTGVYIGRFDDQSIWARHILALETAVGAATQDGDIKRMALRHLWEQATDLFEAHEDILNQANDVVARMLMPVTGGGHASFHTFMSPKIAFTKLTKLRARAAFLWECQRTQTARGAAAPGSSVRSDEERRPAA